MEIPSPHRATAAKEPASDEAAQLHLGYERVRAELNAVPDAALLPLNLDVRAVVQTVLGSLPGILALRPTLAGLRLFDMRNVDQLRDYALALGHLDNLQRLSTRSRPTSGLVQELLATRLRFVADARMLIARGQLEAESISQLKGGNGHRRLAFNVIALTEILLERRPTLDVPEVLDLGELERARAQGNRLLAALAVREHQPSEATTASKERQKAFTLLVRSYNEVRSVISYARRSVGDVDAIAPSLYAGRKQRSRRSTARAAVPSLDSASSGDVSLDRP